MDGFLTPIRIHEILNPRILMIKTFALILPLYKHSLLSPMQVSKDFRHEKYGLVCAICLSEFASEDLLRLITVCYHVFHQERIDLWLESHKTCPVCRQDLDRPKETLLEKVPLNSNNNTPSRHSSNRSDGRLEHSITIQVSSREDEDQGNEGGGGNENQVSLSTTRGHFVAESCIAFDEFSSSSPATNAGFGEVSGCSGPDPAKQ